MKILHTSDWHIGKRLMGRERLSEQAAALDEIVGICEAEGVELVLVAGDVFDTYLPGAEAEELFFSEIRKMAGEMYSTLGIISIVAARCCGCCWTSMAVWMWPWLLITRVWATCRDGLKAVTIPTMGKRCIPSLTRKPTPM